MRLTINAAALLRVAPHCSKDASRPILACLFAQASGDLTATNGHSLGTEAGAVEWPGGPPEGQEGLILALPKGYLPLARKAAQARRPLELTVYPDRVVWEGQAEAPIVDRGPYPNYRHILPPKKPGTVAPVRLAAVGFDPEVLALFAALGNNVTLTPWPNGDLATRAWTVTSATAPNFTGLVMPTRIRT